MWPSWTLVILVYFRSLEVKVEDFNNSNYVFSVTGLAADIIPEQSNVKVSATVNLN